MGKGGSQLAKAISDTPKKMREICLIRTYGDFDPSDSSQFISSITNWDTVTEDELSCLMMYRFTHGYTVVERDPPSTSNPVCRSVKDYLNLIEKQKEADEMRRQAAKKRAEEAAANRKRTSVERRRKKFEELKKEFGE